MLDLAVLVDQLDFIKVLSLLIKSHLYFFELLRTKLIQSALLLKLSKLVIFVLEKLK